MAKSVGIIGGMGPLATVDMMKKIIQQTPAKKDQDHIHMIVDNYPQIPDRTAAILGKGLDPTPYLLQSARLLQQAGAELIVVACNTADYFVQSIQKFIDVPILHLPVETAKYIRQLNINKVGLLSTDGTMKTKLYQNAISKENIVVLEPDPMMQRCVMKGIYAVKSNDLQTGLECLSASAKSLVSAGAKAIIAGCTEIPLVLRSTEKIRIIDPTQVLAKKVVQLAFA